MADLRAQTSATLMWCVLVGVWSLVFAAPHFYWALGGRAGLGSQADAADAALQQSWFAAYNLAAGVLGLLGAAAGALLASDRLSARLKRWLLIASAVACAVLLLRGALGVGLIGAGMVAGTFDEQSPLILLAIEPWFVLGGLAFGGLVLSQRRRARAGRDRALT